MVCLSGRLLHLLAQEIKRREFLGSRFIKVKIDIVPVGTSRPEAENTLRPQPIFRDCLIEQLLRIVENLARLPPDFRIVKNRGIPSAQLPDMEERRPIDVAP